MNDAIHQVSTCSVQYVTCAPYILNMKAKQINLYTHAKQASDVA